ncbi:Fic/DOC family protein [Bosea sp. PAMC 26642]|uniref:Fic/DOC family protein n=1 Tax=Bosea sp. (strain PAMC 26642) TaxID=1792307 RepID=UPI0007704C5C|nr:Fic family protein [Bosea sp. PAMC 26642]AMJ60747.1 cell division protein [Bosea sp. PAMC 26642]
MSDQVYCYPPDFTVLINKLDVQDGGRLDAIERAFVVQRMREAIPTGNFNLTHLRAIHRHLFQDVYDWAGELRSVEIAKGKSQFQFRRYIETGMADVHRRLVGWRYLQGLDTETFAVRAGEIIGDLNYVHPFREGNGRTQALYLAQLAAQAGHPLDLRLIVRAEWLAASIAAHRSDYQPFAACILAALAPGPPSP